MSAEDAGGPRDPSKGAPEGPAASAEESARAGRQQHLRGKGRKVRFDKNSPNTFTFRLLPAPQHQQRAEATAGQRQQRMQLQRVIPPNARDKPQQPLPSFLQQQLDRQEASGDAAALREEGKTKKGREPDLTADCYFPQDGYDYSQHLVSLGGGTFLAHSGNAVIEEEEKEAISQMERDKEGCEVLAALDACEKYEEIADDFVVSAAVGSDGKQLIPHEKELLWGSRPPLLPPAVSDMLFGPSDGGDSPFGADEDDEKYGDYGSDFSEETDSQDGDRRVTASARTAIADDTQAQRLEQLLEEYRDECIGELDAEEAEESDSFSAYDECFDDFLKSQERKPAVEISRPSGARGRRRDSCSSGSSSSSTSSSSSNIKKEAEDFRLCEIDDDLRQKTLALAKMQEQEDDQPTMHAEPLLPARARPTWDGETIMSARSGVSLQPRSIVLGSSRASKMPMNPFLTLEGGPQGAQATKGTRGSRRAQLPPTAEDAQALFEEIPEVTTFRPRGETPEARKERKARAKEAQRLMRANKKMNKELLKEETKKAQAVQARTSPFDVRPGVRHFKL